MTLLVPASRADLALEFANTRFWRGRDEQSETLNTLDDLLKWGAETGGIGGLAVDRLRAWWLAHPRKGAQALDEAIELREAIYRVFRAVAEEKDPAAADLEVLNRALAAAPARSQLARDRAGYVWALDSGVKLDVGLLLAPVIWAAGDLLIEPARVKVRRCANDDCVWLFLDDSKSGTRRWCAMSACGNRAKAHRHYVKQKKAAKKK